VTTRPGHPPPSSGGPAVTSQYAPGGSDVWKSRDTALASSRFIARNPSPGRANAIWSLPLLHQSLVQKAPWVQLRNPAIPSIDGRRCSQIQSLAHPPSAASGAWPGGPSAPSPNA
jgi:hypothetical protein